MKSIFKILILVSMILLLSNSICMAFDLDIRPVKIKVIDTVTKQPLPGIKLYYVLTTHRPESCFLSFFIPDYWMQWDTDEIIKKELITDEKGEAVFEGKTVNLRCFEKIIHEKIAVNLDVARDITRLLKDKYRYLSIWAYVDRDELLFTINKSYKGFFLTYSTKGSDYEEKLIKYPYYYAKHTLNKLDALRRVTDWDGTPEEYIVELRRAD